MEWLQSSLNKDLFQSSRTSPYKTSENNLKRQESSELIISHLQQSYNERIHSLQNQVKQIYQEVENDALLETMGHSEASNFYRSQRIQEIVEDSLLTEKEIQIESLIQQNSYLKTDFISLQEDSQKLAQASLSEITSLQTTVGDLDARFKEQVMLTKHLEQENEGLRQTVARLRSEYQDVISHSEGHSTELKKNYLDCVANIEQELSDTKRIREKLELECHEKDKLLVDLRLEREATRKELVLTEENLSVIKLEKYKLETSVKELNQIKEKSQQYEAEVQALKSNLKTVEAALRESQESLKTSTKNTGLSTVFLLEKQQKELNEKVEDAKKKYKEKSRKYKEKATELSSINDGLKSQLSSLKQSLETEREQVGRLKHQKEDELRSLKFKLEEKLSRQELEHQKTLADVKTKSQLQVSQLESEKSKLEASVAKGTEALNYASSFSLKKSSSDMESKAKLEASFASQIEQNYILKSKHENILAMETLELKSKHAREIQQLNENFENEVKRKLRSFQENAEVENINTIKIIKDSKRVLEEELEQKKKEIVKLEEKQEEHRKLLKNTREELEDAKKKSNDLHTNLIEANHNVADTKSLYGNENKKAFKLEEDNRELAREKNELTKKKIELETWNIQLKEQIQKLEESKRVAEETIKKADAKNISLNEENSELLRKLEDFCQEKQNMRKELESVKKEFEKNTEKLSQKVDTEQRESQQRELIIQNERFIKESLESTIQGLQQKERELRMELTSSHETCRKLQDKVTTQKTNFKSKLMRVSKIVSAQIESFKKQLEMLKDNVRLQSEKNQGAIKLDVQSLLLCLDSKFTLLRSQKEDQEKVLIEQHQREVEEYENTLKKYTEENTELYADVDELNKHVTNTLDTLEEAKALISNYTSQIESLQQKNARLTEANLQLAKDFQQSQALMNSEVKKVKEEMHVNLPETVSQLKSHYRSEVAKVAVELDELKRKEAAKLRLLEGRIADLQKEHEEQVEDVKRSYRIKLSQCEGKLDDMRVKYEEQARENVDLSEELKKINERYHVLDRDNRKMLGTYEEKISNIKGMIKKETLHNELEKDVTYQENTKLRRDLSDLRQKLQMCDLEIDSLSRVRNDQQECIMKYKNILDKKRVSTDNCQVNFRTY